MKLNIVVLAKQVPDTRNVGKDAMTAEGTVNRAALPAIFNPEDLNALEQALRLKDLDPENVHVGVVTMGLLAPERFCAKASTVVPTRLAPHRPQERWCRYSRNSLFPLKSH